MNHSPAPSLREKKIQRPSRLVDRAMFSWDAMPWAASQREEGSGEGCDDAAFLGLESISGDTYSAMMRGESPPPKESEAQKEDIVVAPPSKKKKKKKKKESPPTAAAEEVTSVEEQVDESVAAAWCGGSAWAGQRLGSVLLRGLSRNGFVEPTAVQKQVLPLACVRGRDVLCASPTGSGKTLAFALPALNDALRECERDDDVYAGRRRGPLRTLIVAPTRELALQVAAHARALLPPSSSSKQTSIVACVTGGLSEQKQTRVLDTLRPPIVVATPGRLWEMFTTLKHMKESCGELRYLVVDEADRMLETGSFPELQKLADALQGRNVKQTAHTVEEDFGTPEGLAGIEEEQETPKIKFTKGRWQTMVFSATLSLKAPSTAFISSKKMKRRAAPSPTLDLAELAEPLRASQKRQMDVVDVDGDRGVGAVEKEEEEKSGSFSLPSGLSLSASRVATPSLKLATLYVLLTERNRKTVVFVNAVTTVRRLCSALNALKVPNVAPLHAGLAQRARLKALDKFAADSSTSSVLIATDVAARGLDVKKLDLVVHYDVASTFKIFVHRAGRTARAGNVGLSVSLVSPQDADRHADQSASLSATFQALKVNSKLLAQAHARAKLALDLAKEADRRDRAKADDNWLNKLSQGAAAAAEREEDHDQPRRKRYDDDDELLDRGKNAQAMALKRKHAQLDHLVDQPMVSKPKRRFVVASPSMRALVAGAPSPPPPPKAPPTKAKSKKNRKGRR